MDNGCEDMLYIYQLPCFNEIKSNYDQSEAYLSWMTKQLFQIGKI